jgi:molecular chaperone HtpG
MTHEELVQNLGRIAFSGSKQFLKDLQEKQSTDAASLIGQFGVGFYSAFMVAEKVDVYTQSHKSDEPAWHWSSDGSTGYEIEEIEGNQPRGTRIVVHLREEAKEFANEQRVQSVIRGYSNFVPFPIEVNGERANKVEALWTRSKSDISDEEYEEFYKFVGNDFEAPMFHLHFSADAPLAINSILFVPQHNREQLGFDRMECQVHLYCRKVMIMDKAEGLLPEWMRFVRGVVDSEDLPLNISRETMQDSALMHKLNSVLAKRFIKFLDQTAKKDTEQYHKFFKEFGRFIKEGVINDFENQAALGKLLRYESSLQEKGTLNSLDDYVTRMKDDQDKIYYLLAPSRESAENSPYFDVLQARNLEVLFVYDPWDEFVLDRLGTYSEKQIVSAEKADLSLEDEGEGALDEERARLLANFIKETLADRVKDVRVSKRLVNSPAAVTSDEHMTSGMRRMMKQIQEQQGAEGETPQEMTDMFKQDLEINPRHALLHKLDATRENNPDLAKTVAEQLYDNAMIAAGLMEDPRAMLKRLDDLMEKALEK